MMDDASQRWSWLRLDDEFVEKYHVRYLPEADCSVVQTIECGVLFVMAFWSVPAVQSFALLKTVLREVDPRGRLQLTIVDIDGGDFGGVFERDGLGGWGETAWINNGQVMSTTIRHNAPMFKMNTEALLTTCLAR